MSSDTGVILLFCLVVALLLGAATRYLVSGTRVPYSVALLVLGLGIGLLWRLELAGPQWPQLGLALTELTHIDPHLILFIFLPTLIFESAYSLEPHLLKRILPQISLLAIPGMLISALLTALLVRWLLPWEWSWPLALLFGALISATDPVAVVALLREVSSRKRLETLLEGESLFNDGTAIVLFSLCLSLLVGGGEAGLGWSAVLWDLCWTVALGALVGYGLGGVAIFWVARVYNDPMVETMLSIASAYVVYFVAEQVFHASGVVAVVMLGILFSGPGRSRFSPEAIEFLHHFWSILSLMANTLIFMIVGLLIADRVDLLHGHSWWLLLQLYFGLLVIRGIAVGVLLPLLKRLGIGINRDKTLVLIWGGLRGAVALALALMVIQAPGLDPAMGSQVLFLTAGIVVLTMLINGSTMPWLFARLGLDQLPPAKLATIEHAEEQIRRQMARQLPVYRKRAMTQLVDWQALEGLALKPLILSDVATKPGRSPLLPKALALEFKRRLLESERRCYWDQYRDGYLGRHATASLIEVVEEALDGDPTVHPRPALESYWHAPAYLHRLRELPWTKAWATRIAFRRLLLGYDIARGFLHAMDEMLGYLPELAPSEEEARHLRLALLANKRSTFALLSQMRESFPELAGRAEYHSACRLLLIQKKAMVRELLERALLDRAEAERLLDRLNALLRLRHDMPLGQSPLPDPKLLIRGAAWSEGLSEVAVNHLVAVVEQRIFEPGEVILRQGKRADALVIVARGAVEEVAHEAGHERPLDVFGPGTNIGADALVRGHHRHTLRAATPADIFWIPARPLLRLIESSPELREVLSRLAKSGELH